ncbi:nephrin-like isoform X2 [Dermacentor andersoni]|uniref:nephrin-like isoform X2 n=1 Tax=Dermacentor andersoni TaxID=34620 RepID=UPI003B3B501F
MESARRASGVWARVLLAITFGLVVNAAPTEPVEVQRVLALPGSQARLPCDLGGSFSGSSLEPSLISWTRGPSATAEPLYSVARAEGVALVQADHRVTPAWKERFHFSVSRGTLSLADVSPRDAGLYVCRVRFQHAVERSSRVELVVVEHPGTPVLKFDPESPGADRLREGQRLRVLCEVVGGKPRPSLRWSLSLSGGSQPTPLEATEGSSDARDGVTRSWATLDKLQRWHHEARLTCQAFNSELVASPTSSLRLQLELKPAQVRIKGSRSPVSADVEAVIECETTGSQPPANISWRLEETPLREAQVLARGANGTASLLRWTPRPQDNGRRLICLALNDRFPEDGIDDIWSLDVHYKPIVELRLGPGLDSSGVQEGHDAYFECSVRSNPPVSEVAWSLDDRRLSGARLIVSNLSLALRQVTRHQAGRYRCTAQNSAGRTVSNAVRLRVKHAPVCEREENALLLSAVEQEVELACAMVAEPQQLLFSWSLNGSLGKRELTGFQSHGARSSLKFRPKSEVDYGTLECTARNSVGSAVRPCIFHLLRPPGNTWLSRKWYNCSVWNATSSAVQVVCQRGPVPSGADSGALVDGDAGEEEPQLTLELRRPLSGTAGGANTSRASSSAAWSRTQSGRRSLWLRGLAPDSPLELLVFADSPRGRSQLAALRAQTLPEASAAPGSSGRAQERRTKQRPLLPDANQKEEQLPDDDDASEQQRGCCPLVVTLACALSAGLLVILPAAVLIGLRLRKKYYRETKQPVAVSRGVSRPREAGGAALACCCLLRQGRRRRPPEIYLQEVK